MPEDFINYDKPQKSKVLITESTKTVLEEDNIVISEEDTAEEALKKAQKSKKVVAKMNESGDVVIKQSLNG